MYSNFLAVSSLGVRRASRKQATGTVGKRMAMVPTQNTANKRTDQLEAYALGARAAGSTMVGSRSLGSRFAGAKNLSVSEKGAKALGANVYGAS